MTVEGPDMGWHIPEQQLAAYTADRLGDPQAWSLETHVAACTDCAVRLAEVVQATPHARRITGVRRAVLERVDREKEDRCRVGSRARSRMWRLLTGAPALRLSWIAAAAVTVACALVLGRVAGDDVSAEVLLLAPLLPVAGVAACYGHGIDPAYEIVLASPFSGLRLLLMRAASVLGVTLPILLGGALIAPTGGVAAAAWLLPALALVLVTLTLGAFVDIRLASVLVGVGWLSAVMVPKLSAVPMGYVYEPRYQLVWAAVVVLGTAMVAARREAYERMGS